MELSLTDRVHLIMTLNDVYHSLLSVSNVLGPARTILENPARQPDLSHIGVYSFLENEFVEMANHVRDKRTTILERLTVYLPTKPFGQLDEKTRQDVLALNGRLVAIEGEVSSWLQSSIPMSSRGMVGMRSGDRYEDYRDIWFSVNFDQSIMTSAYNLFADRSLSFRVPGTTYNLSLGSPRLESPAPAIKFLAWSDKKKWHTMDSLLGEGASGFEPCEVLKTIVEYGGLGWEEVLLMRKLSLTLSEPGHTLTFLL